MLASSFTDYLKSMHSTIAPQVYCLIPSLYYGGEELPTTSCSQTPQGRQDINVDTFDTWTLKTTSSHDL